MNLLVAELIQKMAHSQRDVIVIWIAGCELILRTAHRLQQK